MVGLWKNVLPGHIRAGLLLGLFAIGGILISAEAARRLAQNAAMVEATRAERRVSVLSGELARDCGANPRCATGNYCTCSIDIHGRSLRPSA